MNNKEISDFVQRIGVNDYISLNYTSRALKNFDWTLQKLSFNHFPHINYEFKKDGYIYSMSSSSFELSKKPIQENTLRSTRVINYKSINALEYLRSANDTLHVGDAVEHHKYEYIVPFSLTIPWVVLCFKNNNPLKMRLGLRTKTFSKNPKKYISYVDSNTVRIKPAFSRPYGKTVSREELSNNYLLKK